MNIVYLIPGLPISRDALQKGALGGSETAGIYKAQELARRGHLVRVFCNMPDDQSEPEPVDNLQFIAVGASSQEHPFGYRFEHYTRNTPHDVLIIQRVAMAFHAPFAAKVCIHEHHDLGLARYASQMMAGAWQVSAYTGVSEFHKKQLQEVYGLNPRSVYVVPNGVDPSLYTAAAQGEDPFLEDGESGETVRLIYQSRPERGLDHLVRAGGIMDRLKHMEHVKLYIFGYDNTTDQMADFYAQLKAAAALLPNVKWVGAVDKAKLARYQTFADLMVYPTEFEEVSCITAMEAMHAGLPLITSKVGALPETCDESGTKLVGLVDGKANEDKFVEKIEELLSPGGEAKLASMRDRQLAAAERKTWTAAVDALEKCISEQFQATSGAILRTAIEKSDIRFAQIVLGQIPPGTGDAIVEASRKEVTEMYSFLDSDEDYGAHYAKHQSRYYDEHEDRVVGEDVTGTTRFRGVFGLLKDFYYGRNEEPLKILDYGCAHGHYTMPLAKMFTKCDFTGVDVSIRAVEAFNRWAGESGLNNAVATVGTAPPVGPFDVILAGEVLEHVRDPYALLEQFRASLASGGLLILTTPLGRWEHSGLVEFRKAREHVEHFDRADLEEIFAGHKVKILQAPATVDRSGFPMGSWVTGVTFRDGVPIGRPDFLRKLNTYRPRETISACLIVKDGEKTLRAALESVVDWVDEVRVTVDAGTTDRTEDILQKFADDFPLKPVTFWRSAQSATKDGFEALRNESMKDACGDWILWFDADESVHRPGQLHKLARPSMHDGYGFKQVHYAIDPAQVLSTDMPCRMFRNRKGVRFYGLVHEHPEFEIGKAVPFSIVRPEVEFLHAGYVDEEVRRQRYRRNYPLVLRDFEKYPERKINWFLMLRDMAQGIVFEREQMRGGIAQHHLETAKRGVDLYVKMVRNRGGHVGNRMLIDALPYYGACVETLGTGFTVDFKLGVALDGAPDLSANAQAQARFHDKAFYVEFLTGIIEEATAKYGSKYL